MPLSLAKGLCGLWPLEVCALDLMYISVKDAIATKVRMPATQPKPTVAVWPKKANSPSPGRTALTPAISPCTTRGRCKR